MGKPPRQLKIGGVMPTKRAATRHWRETAEVVAQLETAEAEEAEALKATREALKLARANHREAEKILSEVLDTEDPTIPGVEDGAPTEPMV